MVSLDHDDGARPALLGRLLWLGLGVLASGLALLGFLVPVFPGLPFAILAGLFFATASRRLHRRLARVPAMEGALHRWQRARRAGVGAQVWTALALMALGIVETVRWTAQRLTALGRSRRR
jgi:uncharacterized membrane protein YbaN (DUF454 family)